MLHTLNFSIQNAVCFKMLHFLVPVLLTFYIQVVLKFKYETSVLKGKVHSPHAYNSPLSCGILATTRNIGFDPRYFLQTQK
jgi:hypothetical protein